MDPHRKWAMTLLRILLFFILTGCSPESTDPLGIEASDRVQPIVTEEEESPIELQVETFCSLTKIRTSVARLIWEVDPTLLDKQQIDATVFKQGFDKGFFGSVSPIRPQSKFQPPEELPESERDALAPILNLRLEEVTYDSDQRVVSVDVENLEPGLNYFWRVLTLTDKGLVPSNTVSVEAPVCVADMQDE